VRLLPGRGEEAGAVTRHPGSAAVPAGARVAGGDPSRPKTLTSAQSLTRRDKARLTGQATGTELSFGEISRPALTVARWAAGHATAVRN
jgi:hypothetical protein